MGALVPSRAHEATVQGRMDGHEGSLSTVWDDAVAHTREKSPASFDQWFSGVQYDGMTDGVVSLRARDEFVREWVDDHFLPTLTDFIRARTGWSVQVAWCVDSGLDRPVVDQPTYAPLRPRALSLRPSSPPMRAAAPVASIHEADGFDDRDSGVHTIVEPLDLVGPPVDGLNQ